MANHSKLIAALNEAITVEYTAILQYNQHSMLLTGPDKAVFEEIFQGHGSEALTHAKLWGEKVVWLGGVPTVEVGTVRQSTNLTEMLEMNLEVEKKAVEAYQRAHDICEHKPTQYELEEQIIEEQKDVEQLQKLLGQVKIAKGSVKLQREVKAG